MLVVLARDGDVVADRVSAMWGDKVAVARVSPSCLSRSGWRLPIGSGDDFQLATAIGTLRGAEVTGVWSRIGRLSSRDFGDVVPEDRAFVASEANATLVSLLARLRCRKANAPTVASLCGPGWGEAYWRMAAAAAGWRVAAPRWRDSADGHDGDGAAVDFARVVVVDGQIAISHGEHVDPLARALAAVARVPLLEIRYRKTVEGPTFTSATPFADVAHPALATALLRYLVADR